MKKNFKNIKISNPALKLFALRLSMLCAMPTRNCETDNIEI